MKIAVIGANGHSGKMIVSEAIDRGHDVVAIVRSNNETKAKEAIIKDLFDLNKEDLKGFDAVISAFAAWREEDLPQHTSSLEHLASLLQNTPTKLLVVGGAGSLYLDNSKSLQLYHTKDFPSDYAPLAKAMADGLNRLREFNDVNWIYLSPAANFMLDGEKRNDYQLSGEVFTVNKDGESHISYVDYATAMIDVAESDAYAKQRLSVLWK